MSHQDHNHSHHQENAKHHEKAALHHEQATKSHLEAARMREAGNHEAADNFALIAHGHTLLALRNSEEAIEMHANIQASVQRP